MNENLKQTIKEALERYKTDPVFRVAVDAKASELALRFGNEEFHRMKRDYELFEEISPPDVPRKDFVKWCYDAWDREQERRNNQDSERKPGELLPCPFCGRQTEMSADDNLALGCPAHTRIMTISTWNTRHDSRKPEECKRRRKCIIKDFSNNPCPCNSWEKKQ